MPNWCSNNLYVSGKKEDVTKFKEKAKTEKEPLSFSNFVPMPKEEEENWYEWNIANWGTKWDISNVEVSFDGKVKIQDEEEYYINYMFDTAWSPPIEWVGNLAKQYPELEFELEYREDGVGFAGKIKASGGGIYFDEQVDVDDIWEQLKKEKKDEDNEEDGEDGYWYYEEYDKRVSEALSKL
jgi:hypothetical protein